MAVEQPQCCGVAKLACMAYFYVFSVMLQRSSIIPMDWCITNVDRKQICPATYSKVFWFGTRTYEYLTT